MPSFPDSVFAPANRSNGQTIDASHMNGVQDEIVAIEGGIINGTARVNSSVLNVTGTSTFANRPIMPPPDAVRLQLSDTTGLAAGTTTALAWTNQVVLTNSSLHSTGTNPSRVTPQSTGVYWCHAQAAFNYSSAGSLEVIVEDSSGTIAAYALNRSTGNGGMAMCAAGPKRFDVVGGYMRVVVTGAGSTNSLSTNLTHFSMMKL